MMLAHDVGEAASQTFYSKYAAVDTADGGYRIDLSAVDKVDSELVANDFFVSLKGGEKLSACIGGTAVLHDVRADHSVYKVTRDKDISIVSLKIV